jgi:hypothetical protein
MTPFEIAQSTLARKCVYFTVGWAAKKWYNSSFGLYWERRIADHELTHSDWKKILRSYKNQPHDMLIAAGDLWSMGPFLINLRDDRSCSKAIGRILVRHLSSEIVQHLSVGSEPFLPLVSPSLLEHLDRNIADLRRHYGNDRVIVEPWPRFPKFHGVIYGSHLSYCPWGLDPTGQLTHRTGVRFMHREHDHELFDDYRETFMNGFPKP